MSTRHETQRRLDYALKDVDNAQDLVAKTGMLYAESHPNIESCARAVYTLGESYKGAIATLKEVIG